MREPVVTCDRIRDQRLDARVADVLQLLVVRRVHVGLVRVEPRSAPADRPYLRKLRIVGRKAGALLEWIRGECCCERFKLQRLVAGFDVEIEITPGAPPQRLEDAM